MRDALATGWAGPLAPGASSCAAHLDSAFLDAADFHRISPGLHVLLRGADLAPDTACRLRTAYDEQLARHTAALAGVGLVADAAGGVGTPWAVLKGPQLAETAWPRPDLRASYDLDVLVPGAAVAAILERLLAAGATVPAQDWARMRRERTAQISIMLPSGLACDLHWKLLARGVERQAFVLPVQDVLDRAVPQQLGPVFAPVLDAEDALVHAVVHASLSGAGRLVWLLDIAYLAMSGFDPDLLADRARAASAELAMAVLFRRSAALVQRVLDPPAGVPTNSAAWLGLIAAFDQLRPLGASHRRRPTGRLVVASTRRDSRSSFVALVSAAAAATRWIGRTPAPGPDLHAAPRQADLDAAREFVLARAGRQGTVP